MSKELELDLGWENLPFKVYLPAGWKVRISSDKEFTEFKLAFKSTITLIPPETAMPVTDTQTGGD